MPINDWKQSNTDIGLVQAGSAGVSRAGIVLGAKSGVPTLHNYDDLRFAFGVGATHTSLFADFEGNAGSSTAPAPFVADAGSTGVYAQQSGLGGVGRITTAATNDDWVTLATGTDYNSANGTLFFEARVKLVATTLVALEVGLSDAVSEAAGTAFSDHSVAGVTDVASDAVIFAYDTDAGANWLVNTVKAGTPQAYDSSIAASTDWVTLKLMVNTSGDATFYIDDTFVTTITDAVTPASLLTAWVSVIARTAGAKSADIDYVGVVASRQ